MLCNLLTRATRGSPESVCIFLPSHFPYSFNPSASTKNTPFVQPNPITFM